MRKKSLSSFHSPKRCPIAGWGVEALFPPRQIAFGTGTQVEEASGRTLLAPMELQRRPSER
jgi:hypothetical protein